jgi:predicted lactoylglutathione lyase
LGPGLRVRGTKAPSVGFRGFTLSLLVSQPATVDEFIAAAIEAGATLLKPAQKQFWGGYSGVIQAPDGTIWKLATAAKKNTSPAVREINEIALLLGVSDFVASKRFYLERGLELTKSFARVYAEFAAPPKQIKLGLYKRRALAKDAGVSPDGTGSHRLVVGSAAGPFADPDGFTWEATVEATARQPGYMHPDGEHHHRPSDTVGLTEAR